MAFSSFRYIPLAILFLCSPAQAQECISRPSIQQKLMVAATIDDAPRRITEINRLIVALRNAPMGIYGCRAKRGDR